MSAIIYKPKNNEVFQFGKTIMDCIMGNYRSKTFEWKECTNEKLLHDNSFIKSRELLQKLISILSIFLKKNGYKINDSVYHIDFHRYNLLGEDHTSTFAWHKDDYGATDYEVNTAILYLRKDRTIQGGNLLIKGQNKVNVGEDTLVLMDGRVIHKPEDLEGFGCRDSIVVKFQRV